MAIRQIRSASPNRLTPHVSLLAVSRCLHRAADASYPRLGVNRPPCQPGVRIWVRGLEELLDQYLKATGLENEPESPLFPAAIGKTGKLSRRPLVRTEAADMLKRRLKQAGLPRTIRLTHFGPPASRIFWKMMALLKPLSASPATQTAELQSSMTAGGRRFSSKTWREMRSSAFLSKCRVEQNAE